METTADKATIVRMLQGYAELIDRDCQRRFAALGQGGDLPAKRERLAELNAIIADYRSIEAVEAMWWALAGEDRGHLARPITRRRAS